MSLEIKQRVEMDAGLRVSLCMDGGALEMGGRRFVPDKTKGFIEFYLAHAFPVVSARGKAMHAGTVANSFRSMELQGFNFEHRVASYIKDPEERRNAEDRYIGSVAAVEFPEAPYGGWRLADMMSGKQPIPAIRGIANIFKQAKGVDRFLGEHQSGRHQWTVSMEVDFAVADSGVILMGNGPAMPKRVMDAAMAGTPEDWRKLEIYHIPVPDLPAEVEECWDAEKEQFTKPYRGRQCVLLMGGLNNQVHFKGTGAVRHGAEPTAAMGTVLAGGCGEGLAEAAAKLERALGKLGVE